MKKIALFLIIVLCLSFVACDVASGASKAYKVNFDTDGGAAVSSMEISTLSEAPKTERDGYAFCGWYLDKALEKAVVYPFTVKQDMTLYAAWSKASDSFTCDDASVQFAIDNSNDYKVEYIITPPEMNLKALAEQGYYIKIEVTYEVYYEKTYDIPLDIGYKGAPDHAVALCDAYETGEIREGIATETEPVTETIYVVRSASDVLKNYVCLKFYTYNTQNTVHYTNISVTYTCMEAVE